MEKIYIFGTVFICLILGMSVIIDNMIPKNYCVSKEDLTYCSYSKESLTQFVKYTSRGRTNKVSREIFENYWESRTNKTANLTEIFNIEIKKISS